MKKIAIIIIFILLLNNIYSATKKKSPTKKSSETKKTQNAVELTVVVKGIKKTEGQISIGLYNSKKGWTEIGKEYKGVYIKTSQNNISYIFKNIPEGTYAVAIYHDLNMNKILDKNKIGIPKEGYAFSNNVFGTAGPPDYSKASFVLNKNTTIQIKLRY